MNYRFLICCALFVSIVCGGCSQTSDSPVKYKLSGTVTYQGKPVPKGQITFAPDSKSGNKGPGSGAAIVDGKFSTPPDKGHIGGAHRVRVVGYDGVSVTMEGETLPDGTPLFAPYEAVIDLPKEDKDTYELVVPDTAADAPK